MAGNIKTNSVQLGDSATATQNFVLQTNVDGTAKLARGNVGATTQDILTVDASGQILIPANTTNKLVSAAGAAPVYGVRAWAALVSAGAATPTLSASGNVASVVRASTGRWDVTLATPMPSVNYSVSISHAQLGVGLFYGITGASTFYITAFNTNTQAIIDLANGVIVSCTVTG